MTRESHIIERLLPAGSGGCLHLPRDASSRRYGSPFRPAFFTEIFNN
jgi:hypothetical protein